MSNTADQLAAGHEMNLGGHRLVRLVAAKNEWRCRDCEVTGDSSSFIIGFDGCPRRPESFRQGFQAAHRKPSIAAQAREAWKDAATRTTMGTMGGPVKMEWVDWEDVDNVPGLAARFRSCGTLYRLEYGDGRNPESTYVYAVRDES